MAIGKELNAINYLIFSPTSGTDEKKEEPQNEDFKKLGATETLTELKRKLKARKILRESQPRELTLPELLTRPTRTKIAVDKVWVITPHISEKDDFGWVTSVISVDQYEEHLKTSNQVCAFPVKPKDAVKIVREKRQISPYQELCVLDSVDREYFNTEGDYGRTLPKEIMRDEMKKKCWEVTLMNGTTLDGPSRSVYVSKQTGEFLDV